jgi:hypothetical protein
MAKLVIPPEGVDLPGPTYHYDISHWVEYNYRNRTVETWCRMGDERQFKLKTRIRPMCESEIIHAKTRHHSRESVLNAFGVNLADLVSKPIPLTRWQKLHRLIKTYKRRMKA